MSRADGVHSSTCLHIAEPCDRPSCSWCSCDEEPLADWERDLLNEANATATLTAERDRARDIAARLEGELARVREAIQLAIDTEQIPDWDGEPILLCPDWCWTKLAEHLLTVIAEDGAS